ncbi:MAG: arylamine N-acetyltransferase, partial [Ignavibacteria bacterium]|nr:arylamine N-acetyltransferase [Ignavibacteria bacterium]
MNIDKYLERINYKGKTSPNLDNFKSIHRQHLYNIPFENLDIWNKVEIKLDIDNLEKKIIYNNRGGYCYELNGLFYHLLKEIGYNVKMISARVSNDKNEFGPEFDHLALITELDELWLTDVGFGDNFLEPIALKINKPQKNPNGWFKITEYENEYENEGDNVTNNNDYL